jgi:HEAT repeat protein
MAGYHGVPQPDWELARQAEHVLSSLGPKDKAAIPTLLREGLARLGNTVGEVLRQIDPAEGTRALADALRDPALATPAAVVLCNLGPQAREAVPALAEAARSPDLHLRRAAFSALQAMAAAALPAVPGLIECLRSGTKEDQIHAAVVIGKIGPEAKAAVPALIVLLEDEATRLTAARALGVIGPEAKDAVPALRGALIDPQRMVREAAAHALEAINPKAPAGGAGQ